MKRPLYDEVEGRRDSLQLYADILRVADRPSKMTRLMRLGNIQYSIFRRVVGDLVEAGFLDKSAETVGSREHDLYTATKSGQTWADSVDTVYQAVRCTR